MKTSHFMWIPAMFLASCYVADVDENVEGAAPAALATASEEPESGASTECGTCAPQCGNNICESGETCSDCPSDCGACPPQCGNGICESGETCSSCSCDCGACPPQCGNGTCESGETCSTCSCDCGACPPGPGTATPGYWKNHPDAWPVEQLTLGGTVYTKAQLIAILNTPPKGDVTYILARHLISAKLNVLAGNTSSCVDATIAAADAWIAAYPVGSGVSGDSAAWDVGEPLADTLDDYNNGLLCAPHRD